MGFPRRYDKGGFKMAKDLGFVKLRKGKENLILEIHPISSMQVVCHRFLQDTPHLMQVEVGSHIFPVPIETVRRHLTLGQMVSGYFVTYCGSLTDPVCVSSDFFPTPEPSVD